MYHSFAPYGGVNSWKIDSINEVCAYYWWDKFVFSFMLEALVFISGYVFSFQLYELKRDYSFHMLLKQKIKRLLIPSLLFSLAYVLLFYDSPTTISEYFFVVYDIVCGAGHLWFCPMLFWCFVLTIFITKIKKSERVKLLFLLLLAIFSLVPLPLRLDEACYYEFFFYMGVYLFKSKEMIIRKYLNSRSMVLCSGVFFVTFVWFTVFREYLFDYHPNSLEKEVVKVILYKFTMITYSSSGLFSFYLIALKVTQMDFQIPSWVMNLNQYCMGIYVIHQFYLKWLYGSTCLPEVCGTYALPWAGYFITLTLSIGLAILIRLVPIGKKLI